MCLVFVISHAAEANLEHIEIVPAARHPTINVWGDFVQDMKDGAVVSWSNTVRVARIVTTMEESESLDIMMKGADIRA